MSDMRNARSVEEGPVSARSIGLLLCVMTACAPVEDPQAREGATLPPSDAADLPAFAETIPVAEIPDLDMEMALTLVAMPLSCLDRPHAAPRDRRSYLDSTIVSRVPGYEENRAFYGCWDWHSAVNSTWAMVRLYKDFPNIPLAGLIDEKLNDHLSEGALEGEVGFFEESRTFERPYGWAWLLKLQAELRSWDHPKATEWADHVEPLAKLFSDRMVDYLPELKVPSRSGAHSNTAFALAMMLEAAQDVGDRPLEDAVSEAANRLFRDDFGCPTAYEPWGSDFLSPCLEEAALMAAVLGPTEYLTWLDDFLPPLTSREFRALTSPVNPEEVMEDAGREGASAVGRGGAESPAVAPEEDAAAQREAAELRFLAGASHLIGLAFIRADAINRIVDALPADDARIPALRRIALLHGSRGFDAMFEADYAGSHWIGTFALKYLLTEQGR